MCLRAKMPTCIASTLVCARKQHQCFLCLEPIEKGTVYRRQATAFDGRVYALKEHEWCAAVSSLCYSDVDGYGEGALRDALIGSDWTPIESAYLKRRLDASGLSSLRALWEKVNERP